MNMQRAKMLSNLTNALAELTDSVELYLDWAASPGDDECPADLIDRLCAAQEEARALLDGLGYGENGN